MEHKPTTANLPESQAQAPWSASRKSAVVAAIRSALPVSATRSIMAMSQSEARAVLTSQISSLGQTITAGECDACLGNLALVVGVTALDDEQNDRKYDLYFALFHKFGVTRAMLRSACEAFAMAPSGGRPKWFPDPGTLFGFISDQVRDRKDRLAKLHRALDILEGREAAGDDTLTAPEMRERMSALVAKLRITTPSPPPAPQTDTPRPMAASQRKSNPTELRAALERRIAAKA